MSQQSPLSERSYLEKYRKPILVSLAIIFVVIVLVIPIIPIQYTVTETRTRNLRYSSQLYHKVVAGMDIGGPYFVNVTNTDSIGGSFSVTMKYWSATIINGQAGKQLEDTYTQSSFINAKTTQSFSAPENWFVFEPIYSFSYSVSAPSIQQAYNVTKTEYRSILNLVFGS